MAGEVAAVSQVGAAVAAPRGFRWREPSALPGFGLSFGITVVWLSGLVLIPLAGLLLKPWQHGVGDVFRTLEQPRVWAALRLSFGAAALAALLNMVFGLLVAWVLVRHRFPGRRLADAMVDLPFALPTAVAGIALAAIYAPNGWVGRLFAPFGVKIAYTPLGVMVALIAVGLPFVVRSVQPVLEDLEPEVEEAALTLGASALQRFARVVLPALLPALISGFALAFARGVGEYGSVIFIAGNLPGVSEIAPLVIVTKLEQFDYAGAATVGVAMLALSFVCLLAINALQLWLGRRSGG